MWLRGEQPSVEDIPMFIESLQGFEHQPTAAADNAYKYYTQNQELCS